MMKLIIACKKYLAGFCWFLTLTTFSLQAQGNKDTQSVISTIHDQQGLNMVQRVVVFFSGEDPFHVKLLEEALTIELRELNWEVVPQLDINTAVKKEMLNWDKRVPDSVRADDNKMDQWLKTLAAKDKPLNTDDDAVVASLVNADAYISGTVLIGRHQYVNQDDESSASSEKIVITTVSFQINNANEKTLFEAVLGYFYGKSEIYVASDIRKVLEKAVKH